MHGAPAAASRGEPSQYGARVGVGVNVGAHGIIPMIAMACELRTQNNHSRTFRDLTCPAPGDHNLPIGAILNA